MTKWLSRSTGNSSFAAVPAASHASVATSPVTKNIPSLRYLSYRLNMEKRGTDWLITQMNAITSLDLTPRL